MSKISDQSGRQIHLNAIVDQAKGTVQIIRNLHNSKGFLVDSGNMGWMPIDEFMKFTEEARLRCSDGPVSLFQMMTGVRPPK